MTDPNNPPLEVPARAWAAASDASRGFAGRGAVAPVVYAAAPLIVAAELRRLADEFDEMAEHWENAGDAARASVYRIEKSNLHKRAIQLDGGA